MVYLAIWKFKGCVFVVGVYETPELAKTQIDKIKWDNRDSTYDIVELKTNRNVLIGF